MIEDPGGAEDYRHGGWTFEISRGEEGDKFKLDELQEADAQLLGRSAASPTKDSRPPGRRSKTTRGFAEKMNGMPKYVVSSTLEQADWQNSTILSGDPAASVAALKDEVDGVILVAGSATLVRSLMEDDLVDELRLMVSRSSSARASASSPMGRPSTA